MLETGIAAYAETNNIVVLHPQTVMNGCWDWCKDINKDLAVQPNPHLSVPRFIDLQTRPTLRRTPAIGSSSPDWLTCSSLCSPSLADGATGANFDTKTGVQMNVAINMAAAMPAWLAAN